MAYNKRKHLEENIKAIEAAFSSSIVPSVEEETALRSYSGFGGLKCILNPAEKESDIER